MQHKRKNNDFISMSCNCTIQDNEMVQISIQKTQKGKKKVYQKKRKPMCSIKIDLKALLKQKRYTYQQLAECAGVSTSTISRICHKSNTCPTIAQKVATALGRDVEDLFLYI